MEQKQFENIQFNIPKLTPVVKILIIVNVLLFFIDNIIPNILPSFLIWNYYKIVYNHEFWRLITYSFTHLELSALIGNMFVFWFFGSELENKWGSRFFSKYLLSSALFTGLIALIFASAGSMPLWGANAAALSLLTAYAINYPDRIVYLMLIFPIKVKWLVIVLGCITLLLVKPANPANLIYLSHLIGILTGILFLKSSIIIDAINLKFFTRNIFKENIRKNKNVLYKKNYGKVNIYTFNEFRNSESRASSENKESKSESTELDKRVDELLDKIKRFGMDGLNAEEKGFLKKAGHLFKSLYKEEKGK